MTPPARLPAWKPALWGAGQIAVQVYRDMPSLLLLFYMTQILAIAPTVAGLAIFIPKLLWSTVSDFVVGTLSDRYRARVPRRFLLLAGALLLPIALIAVFLPPSNANVTSRVLYVSTWLFAYVSIFSLFSVPHLSIGVEMSDDPPTQSRIMAWRTAFVGVGVLIGAGLAPWLIQRWGGGGDGYRAMSRVMAAICSTALILAFIGSNEAAAQSARREPRSRWRDLAANRPLLHVLGAFFVQLIGQGAAFATLSYLVVFNIAIAEPLKVLGISVLLASTTTILVQPLLIRLTNRLGAGRGFMVGSALYSTALAGMALCPTGSVVAFDLASMGLGFANSLAQQSLFTRLSQLIASEQAGGDGPRNAGFYSSLFVASDKIAFATGGTLVAGSMLGLFGFQSGSNDQSPTARLGIAVTFAVVPLLCNLLAIILMARSSPRLNYGLR